LKYLVNRKAFAIRYKQAFLDWVNSLPVDVPGMSNHDAHRDLKDLYEIRNCFLIPASFGDDEERRFIADQKPELLVAELDFWEENETYWPTERTAEQFDYYFSVETFPVLIDLVQGALARENVEGNPE